MDLIINLIKIFDLPPVRASLIGLAIFIFSFSAFRRLKEDRQKQEIIQASVLIVIISSAASWLLSFCSFFDELPIILVVYRSIMKFI